MRIDILTLFPSMFSPLDESIIGKAKQKGLIDVQITDIRGFAKDKHRTADDSPYGGGPGMVMRADLIFEAIRQVKSQVSSTKYQTNSKSQRTTSKQKTIFLSPGGKTLTHDIAKRLADNEHLILICGHYEGVDQRVIDELVDEEISIGDYVLTGGELPAMVLIDALARFIPGVLGDETSAFQDSFSMGMLEHPQYTKPDDYLGFEVPQILKSGNHKNISRWRREQALWNTFFKRPDLLSEMEVSMDDMRTLESIFLVEGGA